MGQGKLPICAAVSVAMLIAAACSENKSVNLSSGGGIGFPTSFTKRAYMEVFTGTWCAFCSRGSVNARCMDSTYGDLFICAAVHSNDAMATTQGTAINRYYAVTTYPRRQIHLDGRKTAKCH